MPDCYVTKRGYQPQCDKPLHRAAGLKQQIFPICTFRMIPINCTLSEYCKVQASLRVRYVAYLSFRKQNKCE